MKIMIDEKAAKLVEELSEVVAVEDGNLQINGETNTNSIHEFNKTIKPQDLNEQNVVSIPLPRRTLLKSIQIIIYKNRNPITGIDNYFMNPFDYSACIYRPHSGNELSYNNDLTNTWITTGDFEVTLFAYAIGGDEENSFDIKLSNPMPKEYEITIGFIYQTNNMTHSEF